MSAPAGPDLRDIHLPPAPSWWPPAPGWWLLALVVIALVAYAIAMLVRALRERRWRRRVAAELERIAASHAAEPDPVRLAADVSQLLRRASLLIEPEAAALNGEAWLAFLDRRFEEPRKAREQHSDPGAGHAAPRFRTATGRALIDAPYRRAGDPAANVDAHALLALARMWLRRALPRRSGRA
ncbi:MAG TPA: DUF4381 domain-containing protein [Rhodanobacteraceae bacterium]|nr:DUF4381 domain-containing protein [Rhodanobacteraceae bacterium]